ncbi:DUF192 domain-containing protein [Microvirga sp. VF16]|uniref:DUF192 domain-containing protein n=1 Tax=Microvirga sp. VF16 TaxID=2807101 RepID=UPI00193D6453|nr:DUF192 domain-containing protein [Microvirga sp. VF16]QRM35069.1 DUF192 domain-containing protein [Microvirga sp. VF16]
MVDDSFILLVGGQLQPTAEDPIPEPGTDDTQTNDFVVLAGGFTGTPLGEAGQKVEPFAADDNAGDVIGSVANAEPAEDEASAEAGSAGPIDPDNPVIDVHDPYLESFGPLPDPVSVEATPTLASVPGNTLPGPYHAPEARKSRRWPWSRAAASEVNVSYDHDWGTGISVNEEEALRQRLMNKNQPPKKRRGSLVLIGTVATAAALVLTAGSPTKILEAVPSAKKIVTRVQNDLISRVSLTSESPAEQTRDSSMCAQQPSTDGCFTNNVIRAAAFVCPTAMHPVAVEFASSPVRAAVGLSHRASMAPSTGFATILSAETTFDFMTRDLNFAVDLISFRRNGSIAGMLKNVQPRQQLPVQVAKADGIIALRGNEIERLALTPDCRIAIFENGIPPEYFAQDAKVNNSPVRIPVKPQTQAQADLGRR